MNPISFLLARTMLSLLWSTTFALNPHPVNLSGRMHFSGERPLKVLYGGNAGVEIDVTKLIPPKPGVAYLDRTDEIKALIPPGSIHAELKRKNGSIITLTYVGFTAETKTAFYITMDAAKPLNAGETFDGVDVIVGKPLNDVTVYWREAQE